MQNYKKVGEQNLIILRCVIVYKRKSQTKYKELIYESEMKRAIHYGDLSTIISNQTGILKTRRSCS